MAQVLVNETSLSNIADAIRAKLDVATEFKPSEMAAAIGLIHGDPVLQTKTATQNGDVEPDAGYDGLSKVIVNVSGQQPTLIDKTITENGEYLASGDNADGYSKVTVNVSGGGGSGGVYWARANYNFDTTFSSNAEVNS